MDLKKEELIKPFSYSRGRTGILLIHGFTACPIDMKPLGDKFLAMGYSVSAPLLTGHGSIPEELRQTSWNDWVASAEKALNNLRETCDKIIAIGHSMGGLIALLLASQGKLDGVVSINTPIVFVQREFHFIERLLGKQEFVEKSHKASEISVNGEGLPHFSYTRVPVEAFVSFVKNLTLVQNELSKIECPALVIQSLEDKTVHPQSGRMIEKCIANRKKEVIYWAKQDHYLILSSERDKLAEKIQRFMVKFNLSMYTS